MKKAICTTTINPPSEALLKFASLKNWDLIVALDMNSGWTQQDWEDFKGEFKSIQLKKTSYPTLGRSWKINRIRIE